MKLNKKGLKRTPFLLPKGHTIDLAGSDGILNTLDIIALKEIKEAQLIIGTITKEGPMVYFFDEDAYWPEDWDNDPKEWFKVGSLVSKKIENGTGSVTFT